jgi:hypothetical protein
VIAAAILFFITLFKYLGDGPMWNASLAHPIGLCEKYWWSALLHIQNYVNPDGIVSERNCEIRYKNFRSY